MDDIIITEKEMLKVRLEEMERKLDEYKVEFKKQRDEFVRTVNEEIDTDEFYNKAAGMLSSLSRIKSLTDQQQKDVDDVKEYLSKLN